MNKSIKLLTILFLIATLFSSCASIFSKKTQNVVFQTSHPNTKIKFKNPDNICIDSTHKDKIVMLSKDAELVKFSIELDSHLTANKIIAPTNLSPLYYLTKGASIIPSLFIPSLTPAIITIPIMYLYIIPPIDVADKTYSFKDTFNFITFNQKIKYWDSTYKLLNLSNISIDLHKDSNLVNYFDDIKEILDVPSRSNKYNESFTLKNTIFYKDIEKQLIKTKFIDTLISKSVFMDNTNINQLECKISNILFNNYSYKYKTFISGRVVTYINSRIATNWVLKDNYGDTLFSKYIISNSGDYYTHHIDTSISDALIQSFTSFMNDSTVDSLMKRSGKYKIKDNNIPITNTLNSDSISQIQKEQQIFVSKNFKQPTSLEDAMLASFTIKSNDGHGSGFLISEDGYLITNHHVIVGNKKFTAIDYNGKEFELEVIRSNKDLDLALCKIKGNFEFAFTIPDVKNFSIGIDVYAIGTPRSVQLGQSITRGILSGYRTNPNNSSKIIQTDAKINGGNSGGALINTDGNLLGVVDYKLMGLGVEGLSFGICATEIKKALNIE